MLGLESIGESPLCGLELGHVLFIDQTLVFVQDAVLGHVRQYETTQDLLFTQSIEYRNLYDSIQALTLSQALACESVYLLNIVQNLNLQQTAIIGVVRDFPVIQTLGLTQEIKINNIYSMLLCHCISFQQFIKNAIELSITQSLNLEFIEREVIEHLLSLQQLLESNMDDLTCCGVGAPDKSSSNNLAFTQLIGVGMVYTVNVEQDLDIFNTVAWRP